MNKIEQITCNKCSTLNPLYTSICINCKSYLRERVVNIDLWKTIGLLIEDPSSAFRQIIFAENKNFIIFITLFIALKNLLITRFLSVPFLGKEGVSTPFIISYFIILGFTLLLFIGFTLLQKIYFNKLKTILRVKDIYASDVYAFVPFVLGIFFIFPIELVVLGGDVFSNNPTPFQIKPTVSYLLTGFELLTFLWSFVLLNKSMRIISGKTLTPILFTVLFLSISILSYIVLSHLIFSLY